MRRFWIWPIALYLFLGGLGGGMMCFSMVLGVMVEPSAVTSGTLVFGVFVAFMCLLVGTALLVFELGQPKVFYRAFVAKTAVIKWGAVVLSISMIFGFLFIVWEISWFQFFPFIPYEGFARFCLIPAGVAGCCVMVYTGVLLSSLKGRPFWNTPALPVLFTVSALSTGAALLSMCVGVWPFPNEWLLADAASLEFIHTGHEFRELLHVADRVLIVAEMVVLLLFVMLQFCASNNMAKRVADRWVRGSWAFYFWGLLLGCGLLVPLFLNIAGGAAAEVASPVIALAGGCLLRFMIVWSNERRLGPGEEKYHSRLPKGANPEASGNDEFMDYWAPGRTYWTEVNAAPAAAPVVGAHSVVAAEEA